MEKPTPQQALNLLDAATTPKNIANLNRSDFAAIQTALQILQEFITEKTPKEEKPTP